MKRTAPEANIQPRTRPSEPVSLLIPTDVLTSLQRVAEIRGMSVEALIKFYVGQGLREELARLFYDRVLTTTAEVLTRHLESDEQVAAIMQEIKTQATE